MRVSVRCPACGMHHRFNGRGPCTPRCGSYLIHHFRGRTLEVTSPKSWIWYQGDGDARVTFDDGAEETGRWVHIAPGLYEIPDRRFTRIPPRDTGTTGHKGEA